MQSTEFVDRQIEFIVAGEFYDDEVVFMRAHGEFLQTRIATNAMLDVDHFKRVNDDHGHAAGDLALCHVAQVLSASTRATDVAARYGGEEFLVVLPATDVGGAARVAQQILDGIAGIEFEFEGQPISLTASAGVAEWNPLVESERDSAALMHEADRRLYHAKATGRNRVCAEPSNRTVG